MGNIVKIHDTNKRATALSVNLKVVNIPHNKDFPLASNYVEALGHTNINFTLGAEVPDQDCAGFDPDLEQTDAGAGSTRGPAAPAPEELDERGLGAAAGEQQAGGDNLQHQPAPDPPGLVIRSEDRPINQVPGGDNLAHEGALSVEEQIAGEGERDDAARQKALEAAAASADGTAKPVVELTNEDPHQTAQAAGGTGGDSSGGAAKPKPKPKAATPAAGGKGGTLAVEPFDAGKTLERTIPEITEDLDEFDAAQVDALIAAEKAKGKAKRKSLLGLLTKRQKALAEPPAPETK